MTEQHKPCPDWISLLVVMFVGFTALLLSGGVIYLTATGKESNAALYTMAGSAITGLASLLSNPHRNQQRGTDASIPTGTIDDPVNVTAPANAPVNVVDAPTTAAADLADVPTMAVDDDNADEIPLPSE